MDAVFTNWIKIKEKHIYDMCYRYMQDDIKAKLLKSIVLEKIWINRHLFKMETGLIGFCRWTGRIVHNEFVNFKRKPHEKNPAQDIEKAHHVSGNHDLHRDLEVSEKLKLVFAFVAANWDEDHVKVFHMVFVSGMKYQDVATELSMPLNTVKTRIFRIRESVQKLK